MVLIAGVLDCRPHNFWRLFYELDYRHVHKPDEQVSVGDADAASPSSGVIGE